MIFLLFWVQIMRITTTIWPISMVLRGRSISMNIRILTTVMTIPMSAMGRSIPGMIMSIQTIRMGIPMAMETKAADMNINMNTEI